MAYPLSTYTTPAEIRAVLGVSATELSDDTIALSIYATNTELVLEDINTALPTNFSAVSALPTPTTTEQRFIDLVKLYVPYVVAKQLLTSLPMFSVVSLSDGRAEFSRNADAFADVRDGVDAAISSLKYRLSALYATLFPGSSVATRTTPVNIAGVGLAINPVTNA